MMNKQV